MGGKIVAFGDRAPVGRGGVPQAQAQGPVAVGMNQSEAVEQNENYDSSLYLCLSISTSLYVSTCLRPVSFQTNPLARQRCLVTDGTLV